LLQPGSDIIPKAKKLKAEWKASKGSKKQKEETSETTTGNEETIDTYKVSVFEAHLVSTHHRAALYRVTEFSLQPTRDTGHSCRDKGGPFDRAYDYDPSRPDFQAPYISSSTLEAIHHRPQSGAYLFCPSAECHLSSDSSQSVG
jgi:hypothetical protein